MDDNKIGNKILEKIREEKISPEPKWKFSFKNYFFWTAFGFSIFVGSISISMIMHSAYENDWDIYRYLDKSFFEFVAISLPYFWIVVSIFILAVACYDYKHTRKGYRYRIVWIIFASMAASFILGIGSFYIGMGDLVDDAFSQKIPYYRGVSDYKKDIWYHPENGLLAGKVKRIISEGNFDIEDFKGVIWEVQGNNIIWHEAPEIEEEVKIIGAKSNSCCLFVAKEVRSWIGKKVKGKEEREEDGD